MLTTISYSCQNSYKDYKFVHTIPDSLRSEDDVILLKKLKDIVMYNYKVEDNKVTLDISKQEFKERGIPVEYYYKIQDDLKELNKYVNSTDSLNMKLLIDSLKADMRRVVIE